MGLCLAIVPVLMLGRGKIPLAKLTDKTRANTDLSRMDLEANLLICFDKTAN